MPEEHTEEEFESFDPQRKCPACAWPIMTFKYVPAKREALSSDEEMEVSPEHLLRTCERCGRAINMQLSEGDTDEHGRKLQ